MPADDKDKPVDSDTKGTKSAGDNDHKDKSGGRTVQEQQDTSNTPNIPQEKTPSAAKTVSGDNYEPPELPQTPTMATVSGVGSGVTSPVTQNPPNPPQPQPPQGQTIHGNSQQLQGADTLQQDAENAAKQALDPLDQQRQALDQQTQQEDADRQAKVDDARQVSEKENAAQGSAYEHVEPQSSWGKEALTHNAASAMNAVSTVGDVIGAAMDCVNNALRMTFNGGLSPGSIGRTIGMSLDSAGKVMDNAIQTISTAEGIDLDKLKQDKNAIGTFKGKRMLQEEADIKNLMQDTKKVAGQALAEAIGWSGGEMRPEQMEQALKNMSGNQLRAYGEKLSEMVWNDPDYQRVTAAYDQWKAEHPNDPSSKFPISAKDKAKINAYNALLAPYQQVQKESDQRYKARAKAYKELKAKLPEAKRMGKEAYAKVIHDFRENYYNSLATDEDRMVIDYLGGVDKIHLDGNGNLSMDDLRRARNSLESQGVADARVRIANSINPDPNDMKLVATWEYVNDIINKENIARQDLRNYANAQEMAEFRRTHSPMIVGLRELYGKNYADKGKIDPNTNLPMTGEARLYVKNYCDSVLNDPNASDGLRNQAKLTSGMMDTYTHYFSTIQVAEKKLSKMQPGSPEYDTLNREISDLKDSMRSLSSKYSIYDVAADDDPDRYNEFMVDMNSTVGRLTTDLSERYALTKEVRDRIAKEEREAKAALKNDAQRMEAERKNQERENKQNAAQHKEYWEEMRRAQVEQEKQAKEEGWKQRRAVASLLEGFYMDRGLDGREGSKKWHQQVNDDGLPRSPKARKDMLAEAERILNTAHPNSSKYKMAYRARNVLNASLVMERARAKVDRHINKLDPRDPGYKTRVKEAKDKLASLDRQYRKVLASNAMIGDAARGRNVKQGRIASNRFEDEYFEPKKGIGALYKAIMDLDAWDIFNDTIPFAKKIRYGAGVNAPVPEKKKTQEEIEAARNAQQAAFDEYQAQQKAFEAQRANPARSKDKPVKEVTPKKEAEKPAKTKQKAPKKKVGSKVEPPVTKPKVMPKEDLGDKLLRRMIGSVRGGQLRDYLLRLYEDIPEEIQKLPVDDRAILRRAALLGENKLSSTERNRYEDLRRYSINSDYVARLTRIANATGLYSQPEMVKTVLDADGKKVMVDRDGNHLSRQNLRTRKKHQMDMFGETEADVKNQTLSDLEELLRKKYKIQTLDPAKINGEDAYLDTLAMLEEARLDPGVVGVSQDILHNVRNKLIYGYTSRYLRSMKDEAKNGEPLTDDQKEAMRVAKEQVMEDLRNSMINHDELNPTLYKRIKGFDVATTTDKKGKGKQKQAKIDNTAIDTTGEQQKNLENPDEVGGLNIHGRWPRYRYMQYKQMYLDNPIYDINDEFRNKVLDEIRQGKPFKELSIPGLKPGATPPEQGKPKKKNSKKGKAKGSKPKDPEPKAPEKVPEVDQTPEPAEEAAPEVKPPEFNIDLSDVSAF